MEDIVRQAGEFQGLKWVLLRAGFVYSAHDWHTRNLFSQLAAGKIPPLAGERSYVSPIHAEDLAEAVVRAVDNAPAGSTFNIVDDCPVRLNELLTATAVAMGVKSPGALPSFLIRLYMGKDLYRLLQTSCRVSNQRAQDVLGWRPRFPSVLERLEDEVAIWRAVYDTDRAADARPHTRTPEVEDV
jgi:nucleoside-diphosphate-sugar epimerase